MKRTNAAWIRWVILGMAGVAGMAGCERQAPTVLLRDHYATLEDCAAEWGAARCDRLLSSGYAGGAFVFRGPAYPEGDRDAARPDSHSPDASAASRALATVREPGARAGASASSRVPGLPAPDDEDMVDGGVADSLAGLPYFAAFYGVALMLLTVALAAHVALTSRRDIRLIREGNVAVAASMTGALLGLALPLARVLEFSETLLDLLAWGAAALVVQVLVVAGVRLAMSPIIARVREGQVASGVFAGTLAVVLGLLNAAAVSFGFR